MVKNISSSVSWMQTRDRFEDDGPEGLLRMQSTLIHRIGCNDDLITRVRERDWKKDSSQEIWAKDYLELEFKSWFWNIVNGGIIGTRGAKYLYVTKEYLHKQLAPYIGNKGLATPIPSAGVVSLTNVSHVSH